MRKPEIIFFRWGGGSIWLASAMLALLPLALRAAPPSTWTARTTDTISRLSSVAYDGSSRWVVGADSNTVIVSPDGIAWDAIDLEDLFASTSHTTRDIRGVVWNGSQFVAVGQNSTILTSPDGLAWAVQSPPASLGNNTLAGVAHGGGLVVAVGGSGKIIRSADGFAWNEATLVPEPFFLNTVCWGDGVFVTAGSTGTLMRSTDGDTWQGGRLGSHIYSGCTWANGQFVVVGQGGTILTSPDGTAWTTRVSGTAAWLRAVTYASGLFVAVGDMGTVLTSADAVTWAAQTSCVVEALSTIGFGNGLFVVAGGKVSPLDPGVASRLITSPTALDQGFRWQQPVPASVDETGGSLPLTVERIGPPAGTVTATWSSGSGTAQAPGDFTPASGTITFSDGQMTAQVTLSIADDTDLEGEETIACNLQSSTTGWIVHGSPSLSVNLIDDEDSDSDTLPDTWEIDHFGSIAAADATSDPDGDGNDNAREWSDGTDPNDIDSSLYTLTVIAVGNGWVDASPLKTHYNRNETVMLTGNPSSGLDFTGWGGDASGTTNPLPLTLTADTTVTASFLLTLSQALDQPGIDWLTGSTGFAWEGQTVTTFDGTDAADAGGSLLPHGSSSVLEAAIAGPAILTFRWRVSSAANSDFLRLYMDFQEIDAISGNTGWISKSVALPPGLHLVTWSYDRSFGLSSGSNTAWLDTVELATSFPLWQSAYFTAAEINDPDIGGPDGDPDFDGLTNYLEYAYDLDPRSGNGGARLLEVADLGLDSTGSTKHTAISFVRPVSRTGEVDYQLRFSENLDPGSWQDLDLPESVVAESDGRQTVRYLDAIAHPSRRFYQISVSPKTPQLP